MTKPMHMASVSSVDEHGVTEMHLWLLDAVAYSMLMDILKSTGAEPIHLMSTADTLAGHFETLASDGGIMEVPPL